MQQLITVLRSLARRGNAVVVVEHNTEVLEACDRLVELGPGGGDAGGVVIAGGTPRELAADPASKTGPFLFAPAVSGARKLAKKKTAKKKASKKKVSKKTAKGGSR